jgi:hypothetical protein
MLTGRDRTPANNLIAYYLFQSQKVFFSAKAGLVLEGEQR